MTDQRTISEDRLTSDGRPVAVYRTQSCEAPAPALTATGRAGKRPRGVRAGRVAAAGVGVAAMLGLVAQMQVAGDGAAAAAPAAPAGAVPDTTVLRWEQTANEGPATAARRYAAAERTPIVLTPHTIVHTVGGGSSGGSGGYAAAPSYAAPAAAPVASTGGSAPR